MTPEKAQQELCNRVRLHLAAREITQSRLARQAGISGTYLSDVLKGRRYWNPNIIDKFCRTLKLEEQEVLHLHTLGAQSQGWKIES